MTTFQILKASQGFDQFCRCWCWCWSWSCQWCYKWKIEYLNLIEKYNVQLSQCQGKLPLKVILTNVLPPLSPWQSCSREVSAPFQVSIFFLFAVIFCSAAHPRPCSFLFLLVCTETAEHPAAKIWKENIYYLSICCHQKNIISQIDTVFRFIILMHSTLKMENILT